MTVSPVCYLEGTLIRTVTGEQKVEDLAIGDMLITVEDQMRPVKWIGRMSFKKSSRDWQRAILPVRIAKGALGNGLPLRDLFVSRSTSCFSKVFSSPQKTC